MYHQIGTWKQDQSAGITARRERQSRTGEICGLSRCVRFREATELFRSGIEERQVAIFSEPIFWFLPI